MSNELRLKISGDWFDIRDVALDPVRAALTVALTPLTLRNAAGELRSCVEEGILEYKRDILRRILAPLNSLAHDSRALASVSAGGDLAAAAAWCCLQQRRIALGKVAINPAERSREAGESDEEDEAVPAGDPSALEKETGMSPAELIEAVGKLLAAEPELKEEQEAKMVILQLKQYRQEMVKLKELLANIPEEKRKPLKENFAYRLKEIINKMTQGYLGLIKKSRSSIEDGKREEQTGPILGRVDGTALSAMAKRFLQEAELFSRIRSVLLFAVKERYRSRQILMDLQKVGDELLSLVKLEGSDYRTLAPFGEGAKELSMEMARFVRNIAADTADLL